jgi:hypothetical protein
VNSEATPGGEEIRDFRVIVLLQMMKKRKEKGGHMISGCISGEKKMK